MSTTEVEFIAVAESSSRIIFLQEFTMEIFTDTSTLFQLTDILTKPLPWDTYLCLHSVVSQYGQWWPNHNNTLHPLLCHSVGCHLYHCHAFHIRIPSNPFLYLLLLHSHPLLLEMGSWYPDMDMMVISKVLEAPIRTYRMPYKCHEISDSRVSIISLYLYNVIV